MDIFTISELVLQITSYANIKEIFALAGTCHPIRNILKQTLLTENVLRNVLLWKEDIKLYHEYNKNLSCHADFKISGKTKAEFMYEFSMGRKDYEWHCEDIHITMSNKGGCGRDNTPVLHISIAYPEFHSPCACKGRSYEKDGIVGILYKSCKDEKGSCWLTIKNPTFSIFYSPNHITDLNHYTSLDAYIALGFTLTTDD